jgi:hypothetical protein
MADTRKSSIEGLSMLYPFGRSHLKVGKTIILRTSVTWRDVRQEFVNAYCAGRNPKLRGFGIQVLGLEDEGVAYMPSGSVEKVGRLGNLLVMMYRKLSSH